MPQLIPEFFVNQFVWSFVILMAITYVFAKYILPLFSIANVSRLYVTKL